MHAAGFDRAPQRAARGEQPALADHLVERARAHALGERAQFVAFDVQQVRGGCGGALAGQGDQGRREAGHDSNSAWRRPDEVPLPLRRQGEGGRGWPRFGLTPKARSEEHTSELQSLMRISYAVFCLKKKNKQNTYST